MPGPPPPPPPASASTYFDIGYCDACYNGIGYGDGEAIGPGNNQFFCDDGYNSDGYNDSTTLVLITQTSEQYNGSGYNDLEGVFTPLIYVPCYNGSGYNDSDQAVPSFGDTDRYLSPGIHTTVNYGDVDRYTSPLIMIIGSTDRYSDRYVYFDGGVDRYASPAALICGDVDRYRSLAIPTVNVIQGVTPPTVTPSGSGPDPTNGMHFPAQPGVGEYRRVAYEITVNNNGTVLNLQDGVSNTLQVSGFTIRHPRNRPCEWSMKILDPLGVLSPYNSGGPWFGILNTNVWGPGTFQGFNIHVPWAATLPILPPTLVLPGLPNIFPSIVKTITVTVSIWQGTSTTPDLTYKFPNLVLLHRHYSRDGERGSEITLSGTDVVGRYISYRDMTLPTVMSGSFSNLGVGNCSDDAQAAAVASTLNVSGNWFASTVVSTLLNILGVGKQSLAFDDFPIRRLDIQHEKALDIINKLFFINGAIWYSQGDTFIAKQPSTDLSKADWAYIDQQNIWTISEQENAMEIINRVTVGFPISALYGEGIKRGKGYGRFSVNINPPTVNIFPQVLCQGPGAFTSFDCFDANDRWVGHFPLQPMPTEIPPGLIIWQPGGGIPADMGGTAGGAGGGLVAGSLVSKVEFNYVPANSISYNTGLPVGVAGTIPLIPGQAPVPIFIPQTPEPRWAIRFVGLTANANGTSGLGSFIPNQFAPNFPIPAFVTLAQQNFQAAINQFNPASMNNLLPATQTGVTVQNDNSVQEYGIMQPESPIINAIIPNLYWAWRVSIQILLYAGRAKHEVEMEVPPNPFMQPGDIVSVTDTIARLSQNYTVEEVTYVDESGQTPHTQFRAFRYDLS